MRIRPSDMDKWSDNKFEKFKKKKLTYNQKQSKKDKSNKHIKKYEDGSFDIDN